MSTLDAKARNPEIKDTFVIDAIVMRMDKWGGTLNFQSYVSLRNIPSPEIRTFLLNAVIIRRWLIPIYSENEMTLTYIVNHVKFKINRKQNLRLIVLVTSLERNKTMYNN